MMPPRLGILHLTTFLQGGAGRAIADLACAQHAAGHHVTVVTSHTASGEFGNYPEYLPRLRAAGVALYACDSLFTRNLDLNASVVEMLCRTIDASAIDVIHAHAAVPAFIGRLYADRVRRPLAIIQTQHGWGSNKTAEQAAFDVQMLRSVDHVVTTSQATADRLAGFGVSAAVMTVIPCGIPAADQGDPPPHAVRLLQPLRDQGVRLAGCVGSVTANKNQTLIIDALRAPDGPTVAAVFIGEGSEPLAAAARRAGVADRVVACGYQSQASRWLPLLDVLVVPSRTEGQGVVVLEGFRAGVPVVASRIPALEELVDDGKTGLLFPSDDAVALDRAIRRALGWTPAERNAVVAAAQQRFNDSFTVERMVRRHEALYQEMKPGCVFA